MFPAATGMLMEIAITPLRAHELLLIRQVHPSIQAGDVLVDDRDFCFLHALSHCRYFDLCKKAVERNKPVDGKT